MDKFLETYILPSLNHEETNNLNRLITSKEIELVYSIMTEVSPSLSVVILNVNGLLSNEKDRDCQDGIMPDG